MAERVSIKINEDFNGLDYRTTPLKASLKDSLSLTNMEYGEGTSIRGTKGCQLVGQAGNFIAIHTYSYQNTTTGANAEETIAINDILWKLADANLSVTAGANLNYSVRLNAGTNTFRFVISDGSTPYTLSGNPFLDLGNGLEDLPVTIADLREAIDNNVTLTCALPAGIEFARVNGLQSGVSTITVDAGHTLAVGDKITFWDYFTNKLIVRTVTATAATTFTFDSAYGTVNVKDNQVLGPMATPAAAVPIIDSFTSSSATQNIPWSYWDSVNYTTDVYQDQASTPFAASWANRISSNFIVPTFLNINNTCFIFTGNYAISSSRNSEGQVFKYDGQTVYRVGVPKYNVKENPGPTNAAGGLTGTYKYLIFYRQYDNRNNLVEGVETPAIYYPTSAPVAQNITQNVRQLQAAVNSSEIASNTWGGTVATGATTTQIELDPVTSFVANDWILTRDNTSRAWLTRQVTNVTVTGANARIDVTGANIVVAVGQRVYKNPNIGFDFNGAIVNGAQTGVKTITVYNDFVVPAATTYRAYNTLKVGDTAYFYDTRSGAYVTRLLTAVTATSITWTAGGAVDVAAMTVISNNLRIAVHRTKANGADFYFREELPNNPFVDIVPYTDNLGDTLLGDIFNFSDLTEQSGIPPRAAIGCVHQGGVTYGYALSDPNTVFPSIPGRPEEVPIAVSIDLPSNITGPILAIASDSEDRLACFKETAYYEVYGDVGTTNVSQRAIREGDYGISSHASIKKVDGYSIGLGPLGFIAFRNGDLLITPEQVGEKIVERQIGYKISPAILNNPNLRLNHAVAQNDKTGRHYHCYIPSTQGLDTGANNTNTLMFTFDYENGKQWFDKSYNAAIAPAGGFALSGNVPYHLSRNFGGSLSAINAGHVFRDITGTIDTSLAYAQNHLSLPYTWTTDFESLEECALLKEFLELNVFSFLSTYETNAAFTAVISNYRDYQSTTPDTSISVTFNGTTTFVQKIQWPVVKAKGMQFKFVTNTIGQAPFYSGLELLVAIPYSKSNLK